jgi:hypothetical protein
MDILRERPEDMSFLEYKTQLKFQKAWIRNHKRGRLYYIASEILYVPEDVNKLFGYTKTYPPFVGDTKKLIYPV